MLPIAERATSIHSAGVYHSLLPEKLALAACSPDLVCSGAGTNAGAGAGSGAKADADTTGTGIDADTAMGDGAGLVHTWVPG